MRTSSTSSAAPGASSVIRLAVRGAGSMGSNHVRIAGQLRDVTVTHVIDPDRERGELLARSVGATYEPAMDGAVGKGDAAVVAAPTAVHADVSLPLLEAGVPVLVEKPIADSAATARKMIDAAERAGACLMVGHIERFNPAVLELENLVEAPIHLDFTRMSPFSDRVTDSVITDLMIHDLDLALSLV